jgi:translation initiation factor IF-2
MNISTLAKILGLSIPDLREEAFRLNVPGFYGKNTRISYQSAVNITKLLKPEISNKLKDDNRIYLPSIMTVSEFAETIAKPSGIVIQTFLMNGIMTSMNEKVDYDTASLIAEELRVKVYPENGSFDTGDDSDMQMVKSVEYAGLEADKNYVSRCPVVTIMGHVDHGKTTLLDYIRSANVVSGEAGGITQHISSYQINYIAPTEKAVKKTSKKSKEVIGKKLTFIDTPGHAAFSAMRARGSQMADFIVVMVSAVEGPKPQTIEVIERARVGKVPIIIALNKSDLPEADSERVKTEMTKFGVVSEEWGGTVPFVEISAKTGMGVDKLLQTILLMAEVEELKGQVDCQGQAVVIESHLDRSLGVVSTVLVTKDELKVGDIIRCGVYISKVKKLTTTENKAIQSAKLGEPVILIGLPEVIEAGEPLVVYTNQRQAQTDADIEKTKLSHKKVIYNQTSVGGNTINIVLKTDVAGSLEALKEAILKIPQENVKIIIKSEGVGEVGEGDVEFAATSNSTIIAFHTGLGARTEKLIDQNKLNLIQSDVIYEIIEWAETEVLKHKKYEIRINSLGKAEILGVFRSDKQGVQVFGGEVKDGKLVDNKTIQIWRNGEMIGQMTPVELQRNKDKVKNAYPPQQFGMSATGKVKIQKGDIIESIDEIIVK